MIRMERWLIGLNLTALGVFGLLVKGCLEFGVSQAIWCPWSWWALAYVSGVAAFTMWLEGYIIQQRKLSLPELLIQIRQYELTGKPVGLMLADDEPQKASNIKVA